MSENNKTPNDEMISEETLSEVENPYQSVKEEASEVDEPVAENDPKYARTSAPEQSNSEQSKYARTPAPASSAPIINKIELANQTAQGDEEKKKVDATVVILTIVSVLAALVFVAVAVVLGKNYFDMNKNKLEAQKLALNNMSIDYGNSDMMGMDGILEKYREYYNKNNDLVGWITVPNTKIDYPVVQADDNDFYLRKNFEKGYERRGCIFMDYRCDPFNFNKNTILYGHNYLDSTMFSDLEKYKELDFYKSAPVIEFNTIYRNCKWKVFGVYLSAVDEKDDNGYSLYYIHPFMTDDNFEDYVSTVRERSIINAPVDVEKTDVILTLSTCTRDMDIRGRGQTNARCVIVARLVREGERDDVNIDAATYNENPRYPQIWYTARGLENPYVNAYRWYPEGIG